MASLAEEQNRHVAIIDGAVHHQNATIQTVAATTQESAAAAQELSAQAEDMADGVRTLEALIASAKRTDAPGRVAQPGTTETSGRMRAAA